MNCTTAPGKIALTFLFLLASAGLLCAQESGSTRLRERASILEQDLGALKKLKADQGARASASFLSGLEKEIGAKEAALADIQGRVKQAETLEQDIADLASTRDKLKSRVSAELMSKLDQELANKREMLAKLSEDPHPSETATASEKAAVDHPSGSGGVLPSSAQPAAIRDLHTDEEALASATLRTAETDPPTGAPTQAPAPKITFSPESFDFNEQTEGTSSPSSIVTLFNGGDAPTNIAVELSGANHEDFSQTNTCGLSLAAGKDCKVTVTFTPKHTGKLVATLAIKDLVSGNPLSVALAGTGTPDSYCTGLHQAADCRDNFQASAYSGLAIDTFAAGEVNNYLNPNDSNKIKLRGVAGFDFAYRLYKGPCYEGDRREGTTGDAKCNDKDKTQIKRWNPQLWVYGETVHGVRSADVDCKANPNLSVCKIFQDNPAFSPDQTLYILRNATSLEAFTGLRFEFLTLNGNSKSPANLYLKSQAGFVTVAGAGKLTPDHETLALGAIATSGRFRESFLDFGYGRNKLFAKSSGRWKVHAFLSWDAIGKDHLKGIGRYLRPFAELTVDTDFGSGSDSVQSFFGIDFDVDCVFQPQSEGCK